MCENEIKEELKSIKAMVRELVYGRIQKEYYSTAEVAEILKRSEFTVREWCRLNRIWASKRECGRGDSREWMISHHELRRIQNNGLLPV